MGGIGFDGMIGVAADKHGRMIPEKLEEAIKIAISEGKSPFLVHCTAGTTVMGGFDPLRQIRTVCDKYKLWLHVDGAWGGTVIFSERHKHLVDGIELADSFNLNPQKGVGVPMMCSV